MSKWAGKTCVIVASGPGLEVGQVEHAKGRAKVIAVNASFKIAPWADVVYMGDFLAWKVYHVDVRKACPTAELWTQDPTAAQRWGVNRVKGVNRDGLGRGALHLGGNSGFQSINLAYLWGCKKIILLGFTMRIVDGRGHWHADHVAPLIQRILPDEWRKKMDKLAADIKAEGVDVVNCDALSALECFRRSTVEAELC